MIGFIGIGIMGLPIALNMVCAGNDLIVWNRSPEKCEPLKEVGASVALSAKAVFEQASVVFVMLVSEGATDAVLCRGTDQFARLVRDRTIVCLSSNSPRYSVSLANEIEAAGGRFVECPVSGSQKPAEAGELVGLIAGKRDVISTVSPLLSAVCRKLVHCGVVGNGLRMKLSVNLFLNQMLVSLAEAVHFAERNGLSLQAFSDAIDAGPMASDVTRVKLPKLIARDFAPQAAMTDALNSEQTISSEARRNLIATPMLDRGLQQYARSVELGLGGMDMTAVLLTLEAISEKIAVESGFAVQ